MIALEHPIAPTRTDSLDELMAGQLAVSAANADRHGHPDADGLALLRRAGLMGLAVPAEFGGDGADAVELNRCIEQVATANGSAAIMLFQHFAVSARIVGHGSSQQRATVLPLLASGEWLAASAWSEPGAAANKRNISSTAVAVGESGWLLNGTKSFTTSAGLADIYLVLAQTGEPSTNDATGYGAPGQTFFLVRGDASGIACDTSLDLVGMRGSATGFVHLRECLVDDQDRLGPLGDATTIIAGVRESGVSLGAVAVGLAQAAFDLALAHACRRDLLGHSNVRFQLADLSAELEAARAVVERAGRRQTGAPGLTTLRSKLFATAAARRVVEGAERILGSAGFLVAHPINRTVRDLAAVSLMGPTNELCRELVSDSWNK